MGAALTEPLGKLFHLLTLPKSTQLLLKTGRTPDPATTGSRAEPGLPFSIRKKEGEEALATV